MTTVTKRTPTITARRTPTPAFDLMSTAIDLITNKARAAELTKRAGKARDALIKYVEKHAQIEDEKGSQFLSLPEPFEFGGSTYTSLKREKRSSQVFLEEEAEALVRSKGLWEQASTTITVLDQDKIFILNQEGKISDDEIDELFDEKVTWALIPSTGELSLEDDE